MRYIQRKDENGIETIDEAETRKEARQLLKDHQQSDDSAQFYVSGRACKHWYESKKE